MTHSLNPGGGAIPRGTLREFAGAPACVGGHGIWVSGPAGPERRVGQDKARVHGLIETLDATSTFVVHSTPLFPLYSAPAGCAVSRITPGFISTFVVHSTPESTP